jgi:transposase
MCGRKKTYTVDLSEPEYQMLQSLARSQTQPYRDVQRARALVACADHPDWSDDQVAAHIGASPRMVRRWRKRWRETHSLQDAPRSGRPRVFSP